MSWDLAGAFPEGRTAGASVGGFMVVMLGSDGAGRVISRLTDSRTEGPVGDDGEALSGLPFDDEIRD